MARNVILLGKGELACKIGGWFRQHPDYRLRFVVPVIPEPTWTESLTGWCRRQGVPFIDSGHFRDIPCVDAENFSADLLFSVFYEKILPSWILRKARRCLNLHNGPLPRYRGVRPINWALKNGETMHGVTIHEMTPEIDAGPIVAQILYSIYPESDEVIDVYRRALALGYTLFAQTMPILDRIQPRPQAEHGATYFARKDATVLAERSQFTRELSTHARSQAEAG